MTGQLYKRIEKDGGVCFVAVEAEKESIKPLESGYLLLDNGNASYIDEGGEHFNAFTTKEAAQAHSTRQRVFNAIGQACALVDPDGGDGDYSVYFREKWTWQKSSFMEPYMPRVLTRKAAEKVCEVLTEWGV